MKICTKCKTEKPKFDFSARRDRPSGFSSECKECVRVRNIIYREKNKDLVIASRIKSDLKRREKIRIYAKSYYEKNYLAYVESKKKYCALNKEIILSRNRNRRALKLSSGTHSAIDIKSIYDNQRGLCANCKINLIEVGAGKYHVDHIMPLVLGGANGKENLQCLCPACNLRKHAKDPLAWANENGRLL